MSSLLKSRRGCLLQLGDSAPVMGPCTPCREHRNSSWSKGVSGPTNRTNWWLCLVTTNSRGATAIPEQHEGGAARVDHFLHAAAIVLAPVMTQGTALPRFATLSSAFAPPRVYMQACCPVYANLERMGSDYNSCNPTNDSA